MKWSQLKKRIESNFCDSAKGRIEIFETRYRESHDEEGEAWITLDKVQIYNFANLTFMRAEFQPKRATQHWTLAREEVRQEGIFPLWEFNDCLFAYLNLSMDKILKARHPIIRGFGMLDRRFGKRRIKEFDTSQENDFVKLLYSVRCRLDGCGEMTSHPSVS
jgi:hypothetical protein